MQHFVRCPSTNHPSVYQCPLSLLPSFSQKLPTWICTDAHTSYIKICALNEHLQCGGWDRCRLTAQVWSIWAELHAICQLQSPPDQCSPLARYSRHVPYRLPKVPTDSTLERVEAGIPHPLCRLEPNSSRVIYDRSDRQTLSNDVSSSEVAMGGWQSMFRDADLRLVCARLYQ